MLAIAVTMLGESARIAMSTSGRMRNAQSCTSRAVAADDVGRLHGSDQLFIRRRLQRERGHRGNVDHEFSDAAFHPHVGVVRPGQAPEQLVIDAPDLTIALGQDGLPAQQRQ